MNALVGEKMSIITPKPQTTRHRLLGIVNGEDYQMVFSDTPGFIEQPAYGMQRKMNGTVHGSFEDADLMLWVSEEAEPDNSLEGLHASFRRLKIPLVLVLNKTDLLTAEKIEAWTARKQDQFPSARLFAVSALKRVGTVELLAFLRDRLPVGPAYFPEDQLTDRSERFFAAEIIREKILLLYKQEIPYSVEVRIESFREEKTRDGHPLARIQATLFVARKSQKPILIGQRGLSLKQLGEAARLDMEEFLGSKVFLELFVKVRENWRDDETALRQFGYEG